MRGGSSVFGLMRSVVVKGEMRMIYGRGELKVLTLKKENS